MIIREISWLLASTRAGNWFGDVSCTVTERNTQKSADVVATAAATALTPAKCVKSILPGDLALTFSEPSGFFTYRQV